MKSKTDKPIDIKKLRGKDKSNKRMSEIKKMLEGPDIDDSKSWDKALEILEGLQELSDMVINSLVKDIEILTERVDTLEKQLKKG
jgi:hypothetical protein